MTPFRSRWRARDAVRGVPAMDRKRELLAWRWLRGQPARAVPALWTECGAGFATGPRARRAFWSDLAGRLRRRAARRGRWKAAVLAVRAGHPAWGGRKFAAVLRRQELAAPSASTVTDILRRHGVELGGFGGGEAALIRFEHEAPNDLWQMDFSRGIRRQADRDPRLGTPDLGLGATGFRKTPHLPWRHQGIEHTFV